jgi:hypothetical protein
MGSIDRDCSSIHLSPDFRNLKWIYLVVIQGHLLLGIIILSVAGNLVALHCTCILGPLLGHETEGTWPVALQALSLVEKAELVQVRFTLRWREQWREYVDQSPTFFLRICTHTQMITISNDLCSPMPTHSMICAHSCPHMLFKLRPYIQKLCNVYYLPTPSLGWIGQIKGPSMSLASTWSASWLAYSLHPRILTPIWSWMQGCTKPMPIHAHPWTITSHPCPPKTHGHGYGHPM